MERLSKEDKIMILGSCFASNIGSRLIEDGYQVCLNPFGTIFNPASIANSVSKLEDNSLFGAQDCVEMGAGAGKICSFYHHTSFAREKASDFLENANKELQKARKEWEECNKVIVTYGTAQVWKHSGKVVSNCLKRPGYEFTHEMLTLEETTEYTKAIIREDKEYIFTVSPIRHMGEGAHINTLSKATLQLAIQAALKENCCYFPAYEIMLDELRDYSFYAADKVHPNEKAIEIIFNRFLEIYF